MGAQLSIVTLYFKCAFHLFVYIVKALGCQWNLYIFKVSDEVGLASYF